MKLSACVALLFVAQAMGSAILPKLTPVHPIGDWTKLWKQPAGDKIINGAEAEPHSLPYVVALFMAGGSFCTASLISNQWVLTAAHCQDGAVLPYTDVYLGAHNVRVQESGRLEIRATEHIVHENWNGNTLQADIALIKLPSPIDFTTSIQPVGLVAPGTTNLFVGSTARIAGWGKPSDSASGISPTLQTAITTIIPNADCQAVYGQLVVRDGTICTGGGGPIGSGITGTCSGDSGSALTIEVSPNRYEQIGITSFGSSAGCESRNPNGFTRITSYRDWIQRQTGI